ncbi:MAG: response regulator [Magnetococcales bacterium]|nr:response regulator [Magnetococcales bacterium]
MGTVTARVLTVDDSRTVRHHVRQTLEQDDEYLFTVFEAENGAEAVRFLTAREPDQWPDVVVLDRNMPILSGDECIRVLKSDDQWRVIPVLFLTAQDDIQEVVRGLSDLQADAYLPKPFHTDELLARVKVLVRIKRAEDKTRLLNKHLETALAEQKRAYAELQTTRIQLAETQAMTVMTKVFERFVPKQFLQRIAKEGLETIQAGWVESETITILFSDIRSFTQIAETMTPEDLFRFLNDYLSRMEEPIKLHDGFIDKFIGDAVMALFDGHFRVQARNAVRAAFGMQRALKRLNAERAARDLPGIGTGIGIHIGSVMLGTLGNENRMDSTVIGDAVNLASRLEGLTKYYGCAIVASEDVTRFLDQKEVGMRELDLVAVKGRGQAVGIYELFENGTDPLLERKKQLAKRFRKGIALYRDQEWGKAMGVFNHCLEIEPEDLSSQLYLDRCARFQAQPPAADWNGVFVMDRK